MKNTLKWPAAALLALAAGCSGGSPSSPVLVALSATAVTRIGADGQVALKQTSLAWANLPGNATTIDLERQEAGGGRIKIATLPRATMTHLDGNIEIGKSYTYFLGAFDANNALAGSAPGAAVRVPAVAEVGLPVITAPAAGATVSRTEGLTVTWQAPNPVPNFYYVKVTNVGTGKLIGGIILPGSVLTAKIGGLNPTDSAVSAEAIPTLKAILTLVPKDPPVGFDPGATHQLTVSAVVSDNPTDLGQARSVAIRDSAAINFQVP